MSGFASWLARFIPSGAPTAAEWVRILQEAALLHPAVIPPTASSSVSRSTAIA